MIKRLLLGWVVVMALGLSAMADPQILVKDIKSNGNVRIVMESDVPFKLVGTSDFVNFVVLKEYKTPKNNAVFIDNKRQENEPYFFYPLFLSMLNHLQKNSYYLELWNSYILPDEELQKIGIGGLEFFRKQRSGKYEKYLSSLNTRMINMEMQLLLKAGTESIAGLTDRTGRVLGLMPHPERYVRRTQHPHWSRLGEDLDPDGIKLFRNAVRYVRDNLLQSCTV